MKSMEFWMVVALAFTLMLVVWSKVPEDNEDRILQIEASCAKRVNELQGHVARLQDKMLISNIRMEATLDSIKEMGIEITLVDMGDFRAMGVVYRDKNGLKEGDEGFEDYEPWNRVEKPEEK